MENCLTDSPTTGDGLLVIGYGNSLRGDDGMGPAAAEILQGLAVHQLTPELAERIAGARVVIFLDADTRVAPGEIVVKKVEPAVSGAAIEHHASPAALLRLAHEVYGKTPAAWLIGMGGADFGFGERLSEMGRRAVSKAVAEASTMVCGLP